MTPYQIGQVIDAALGLGFGGMFLFVALRKRKTSNENRQDEGANQKRATILIVCGVIVLLDGVWHVLKIFS